MTRVKVAHEATVLKWPTGRHVDRVAELLHGYRQPFWTQVETHRLIGKNGHAVKVLTDGDLEQEVYGVAVVEEDEAAKDTVTLAHLAVAEEYRRQGLGQHLLNLISRPRAGQYKLMRAEVSDKQMYLLKMLTRAGFATDPKKGRDKDADDNEVWEFTKDNRK